MPKDLDLSKTVDLFRALNVSIYDINGNIRQLSTILAELQAKIDQLATVMSISERLLINRVSQKLIDIYVNEGFEGLRELWKPPRYMSVSDISYIICQNFLSSTHIPESLDDMKESKELIQFLCGFKINKE